MTRAPHFKHHRVAGAIAGALVLLATGHTYAQSAADEQAAKEQTVVVLGSRSVAKTALDTASPVGLISLKDLQTAGPLELGKLLQTLDPSFNFSSTFVSDGTDSTPLRPCARSESSPTRSCCAVTARSPTRTSARSR